MIILDSLLRREVVVDQRGANARNFVSTDRCAHTAAANRYAAIDLARHHGAAERNDNIRIVVVRAQAVSTEIDDLMARRAKPGKQFLLQAKSTVVGRYSHAHICFSVKFFVSPD